MRRGPAYQAMVKMGPRDQALDEMGPGYEALGEGSLPPWGRSASDGHTPTLSQSSQFPSSSPFIPSPQLTSTLEAA